MGETLRIPFFDYQAAFRERGTLAGFGFPGARSLLPPRFHGRSEATEPLTRIPFFDYPRLYLDDAEVVQPALDSVLERGAFILQSDLDRFETRLADLAGARHVIGVANGTDALLVVRRGFDLLVEGGSSSTDLGDDLGGGLVPDKGLRVVVPVGNPVP